MIECCEHFRFALKTCAPVSIGGERFTKNLELRDYTAGDERTSRKQSFTTQQDTFSNALESYAKNDGLPASARLLLGALSLAVETLTGRQPRLQVGDLRATPT
jgi:hypothetical protein